jgi:hypothetical protein
LSPNTHHPHHPHHHHHVHSHLIACHTSPHLDQLQDLFFDNAVAAHPFCVQFFLLFFSSFVFGTTTNINDERIPRRARPQGEFRAEQNASAFSDVSTMMKLYQLQMQLGCSLSSMWQLVGRFGRGVQRDVSDIKAKRKGKNETT